MNNVWIWIAAAAALLLGGALLFYTMAPSSEPMNGEGTMSDHDEAPAAEPAGELAEPAQETTSAARESAGDNPIAVVETGMGTFKIELYAQRAPITVENFVKLVEQGYYDGLIFHRVVEGFVIQGGDPFCSSDDPEEEARCGQGGPGWSIPLETHPELTHDAAGVVAMARSQDPDSAGSQFYVTLSELPSLDGNYAVFGRVIEGLEVVREIGSVPVAGQFNRPAEDVEMVRVYLEA